MTVRSSPSQPLLKLTKNAFNPGALYAFSLFLPSIIKSLGYANTKAQLLTVPPYAVACALTILIGWAADRSGRRGVFNIFNSLFGIVGFIILLAVTNPKVKYFATFLAAMGIYPLVANSITWVSNNAEGVYKRGVVIGVVIGWGNLNGVMSSNVYRAKDAPHYRFGHSMVLGYLVVGLLGGSLLNWVYLRRQNAERASGKMDYVLEGELSGKSQREIVDALGDRRWVMRCEPVIGALLTLIDRILCTRYKVGWCGGCGVMMMHCGVCCDAI